MTSEERDLAVLSDIDRHLAVAGTDLVAVRFLEELAEAARRFAVEDEHKKVAVVAKWKVARHGGKVLRDSREARQRRVAGPGKGRRTPPSFSPTLSDLGINDWRAKRWRKTARLTEDQFRAILAAVLGEDPDNDLTAEAVSSTAHLSREKDEWATPADLYALLDAEFHFTLDVCASPDNAKCERFFSVEDDALSQEWTGVCWMNPPYSRVEAFLDKALESSRDGAIVVALVPSRTDVGWFWDVARQGEIRFLRGRLSFTDDTGKTGPAPFPSCLIVFGHSPALTWYDR